MSGNQRGRGGGRGGYAGQISKYTMMVYQMYLTYTHADIRGGGYKQNGRQDGKFI